MSTTTVHLLRHGEVHNPGGVLYGRLEGFRLSERGLAMAERIAAHLAGSGPAGAPRADLVHVVASPLQRAQETAAPVAAAFGLTIATDERQVRDFADARTQDTAAFTAFFHEMLARGVYLPPSAYESWFVSAALGDEAVQRVLDALPAAARAAAAADPADAPPAEVARDAQELSP